VSRGLELLQVRDIATDWRPFAEDCVRIAPYAVGIRSSRRLRQGRHMRTTTSKVLLARQPIIGRDHAVVAHELLYRSAEEREGAFYGDNALATASVVDAAFRRIGIETVAGRVRALVNVDADFLLSRRVDDLPSDGVMLELLETIDIDAKIVARCRSLKERGYPIALDDVCRYSRKFEPILEFADVVKIDTVQLDASALAKLVRQFRPWPARLLAEKVETAAAMRHCAALGFDLFQGFFCGTPQLLGT
jgi:c-di-GMP-related signal transduction protein